MAVRKEIEIHHNTTIPMEDLGNASRSSLGKESSQEASSLFGLSPDGDLPKTGDILPPATGGRSSSRPVTTRSFKPDIPVFKTTDGPISVPTKGDRVEYTYEANSGVKSNPNKFDAHRFIDRISKFCKNREDDLKSSLGKKGKGSLRAYIQKHYESNFSSPRVNLGVDSVFMVVKDYLECGGDLSNSSVLENVLEASGVVMNDLSEEVVPSVEENVVSENKEQEPLLNDNDYYEMVCSVGAKQAKYGIIKESLDTTILPLDEVVKGLVARKRGDSDNSISLLKTDQFEACKGFNCSKFNLVSSSNLTEAVFNRKAEPAESLMFRVCCPHLNKLGCPQSNVYSTEEQIIYDSALEVHQDSNKAHQQILNLRMKKVFHTSE